MSDTPSEPTRVAVVQLCVDDRLDHPRIRAQVRAKLRAIYLEADRIILVGEIGGNFGESFRHTVGLFRDQGAQIVFCGILHHDDCVAALAGRRLPLEQSLDAMALYLSRESLSCPIYVGRIQTATNEVMW